MCGSSLSASAGYLRRCVGCCLMLVILPLGSAAAATIIAAQRSKVYHTHPERCGSARNIEPENRVRFESVKEAEAEGRRLCKFCAKIEAKQREQGTPPSKGASNPPRKKSPNQKPPQRAAENNTAEPETGANEFSVPVERTVTHSGRVKHVLAGGTLVLETGERVRLAGVACPTADQFLADEVATFLLTQTKGRRVQLTWHLDEDGVPIRDALGRIPALVAPGSGDDDLGAALLAEGLGWVDRTMPCTRRAQYLAREDDAAWAQRGIWKRLEGASGRVEVVVGKHTSIYHAVDCPHAVHLTEPVTIFVNEAKGRRLVPCELWRDDKPKK